MKHGIDGSLQDMSLEANESHQGFILTKRAICLRVVRGLHVKNECILNGGENVGGSIEDVSLPLSSSQRDRLSTAKNSSSDANEGGLGEGDPKTTSNHQNRNLGGSALLPKEGYVRLRDVLRVIPIGKSSWWAGCRAGKYPKPIKLGPRTTVWRVDEIRQLIEAPLCNGRSGLTV